jgi:acetyl esterase
VTRRFIAWLALTLAALVFLAYFMSPWPSVLLIRTIFNRGASEASLALDKHVPKNVIVQAAIHYDQTDTEAYLDIYQPTNNLTNTPTIVWIHGGGFVSGQRADVANYLKILAGNGFTVVNIDYSIAPKATYPKPVRQVARAVYFLNKHAKKLGINPNSFVLAGDSAGAQIAAQTANLITSKPYADDIGISAPIHAKQLKGTLLYCGVYDINQFNLNKGGVLSWFINTVTWSYSGNRNWHKVTGFDRMSVARYVTPAFPATFISAGNNDPLGPQSISMANALRSKGIAVESLFYPPDHTPALNHEYQFNLDDADGQQALAKSVAWLKQR